MPDWSYQTALRPLLFRMAPERGRDLSLGAMGRLARFPLGPAVIDFLGHMRPDSRLERERLGIRFPTPIGLGAGIDANAVALPALARFGFGFLEVGPVTERPAVGSGAIERDADRQTLTEPIPADNPGAQALAERLAGAPAGVPVVARLAFTPGALPWQAVDQCRGLIARLGPHVQAFAIEAGESRDATARTLLEGCVAALQELAPGRAMLLVLPPDLAHEEADRLVAVARDAGFGGVIVDGATRAVPGWRQLGLPAREPALALVRHLRATCGEDLAIIAGGGVHEPADALDLLGAGADLVLIDSGLVFSGPGLPKRVNEAILHLQTVGEYCRDEARPAERAWFWAFLMGLGMLVGGLLAFIIAATRVVLPYDEWLVGLSRAELERANERLLAFMAHDRVALAGTMITIGILYCGLALGGIRRGRHWAYVAVVSSAGVGFLTFFLFLGFGYFDPFHAFVTSVLFQFLLLAIHAKPSPPAADMPPGLRDDWRWRLGQWGQVAFLAQSVAFLGAGATIACVGTTEVFVPEDLEFMRATADRLAAVSPRLVPLIAHDRATFGGMIAVSGMVFLMATLWGFRAGARWLWWTFLAAGIPGYAGAIGVHFVVHYENLWHLTPAFAGLLVFCAALALSYPFLAQADPELEREWDRRLAQRMARRAPHEAALGQRS